MTDASSPTPLSAFEFLLGHWEGEGVGGVPGGDDFAFAQELAFTLASADTLGYATRVWSIETNEHVASEAGFWRALPDHRVEIVASHSAGFVEVSLGSIAFTRVESTSDVVARTESGATVTAVKRLYGMVGEELMYAVDMATTQTPLAPRFSGRLRRVG
ncbi:MAG: hypothetical protein JWM93_2721 [Frankiales bacterium]|nr:hypothetical protein [Frankiales bacterium]